MKIYDEDELQASIEAGERKLAGARQRKRQTRRHIVGLLVLLVILIPLTVWSGIVAGRAPAAPFLIVTWPKAKEQQVFASGQTVLVRQGQPFNVSVADPENWDITWRSGAIESHSSKLAWAPANANDRLTAQCRPLAQGFTGLFSFLWPTREVSLSCVEASEVLRFENGARNNYTHILVTGSEGAWIYPHIFAAGSVSWDERILPLLSSAIAVLPDAELGSLLAQGSTKPAPRTWQIVSDFDGQSKEASPNGTFVMLQTPNLEDIMPQVAVHIIKREPVISLKFIERLDKDPREGIFRLAFDGTSARRAWVRRAGQSAGTPLTGWESGDLGNLPPNLPPAPPRR